MEKRLVVCALLALALILTAGCPLASNPQPPRAPAYSLAVGSSTWDTPATRHNLSLHGLRIEEPYQGEGPVYVFTGRAPGVLASRPLSLQPGARYRLSLRLRRETFVNDHFLWLNMFGREHRLDANCVVGGWQTLTVEGRAPAGGQGTIVLRNHTSSRLLLQGVRLSKLPSTPASLAPAVPPQPGHIFPIGAYLNDPGDMKAAADCGLDTVILGAPLDKLPEVMAQARSLGLEVILHLPVATARLRRLVAKLKTLAPGMRPRAFYLQDEPEIRSQPVAPLLQARQYLQANLPGSRVVTAMVRPDQVAIYAPVYDAVFMDQYPVPRQPLNWLADSITRARGLVRPGGEVWGVVQAFGGGPYKKMGWPRPPEAAEQGALAASALAAGAQGIAFYSWRDLVKNPDLHRSVCRLSRRIKTLRPWLPLTPGLPPGMHVQHLGRVVSDPGGGPAVRTAWGRSPGGILVLAVNTTPYTVETALTGVSGRARDLWQGDDLNAVGGQLRSFIPPRGVRAWLLPASGQARSIR